MFVSYLCFTTIFQMDEMDSTYEDLDIILLVGYTVSVAIMLVTLFVYLRTCG